MAPLPPAGAYGFWQRLLWQQLAAIHLVEQPAGGGTASSSISISSTSSVVAVQTAAAVLSGVSSAIITNPLDLVKTRLQVR